MIDRDRAPWEVVQVIDTITPGNSHYSEASRLAKTILKDGTTWVPRRELIRNWPTRIAK